MCFGISCSFNFSLEEIVGGDTPLESSYFFCEMQGKVAFTSQKLSFSSRSTKVKQVPNCNEQYRKYVKQSLATS
jgi:hypothetical protein